MTTPEPEVEMTIEQIVQLTRSKYFTAAFRVTMLVFGFVGSIGLALISWAVFDTRSTANDARVVASEVQQKLEVRTKDNETFQADLTGKVDDVGADIDIIRREQLDVAKAVGRIEGALDALQERVGVASWTNRARN